MADILAQSQRKSERATNGGIINTVSSMTESIAYIRRILWANITLRTIKEIHEVSCTNEGRPQKVKKFHIMIRVQSILDFV